MHPLRVLLYVSLVIAVAVAWGFGAALRHAGATQPAAAVLVVHEASAAGYPWSPVATTWAEPRYALPLDAASPPVLALAGWITTDAARKVFAAAET